MAKKKEVEKEEVKKEEVIGMDELDLEAAREGLAIQKMSGYRVKKAGIKPKVKPFKAGPD